MRCISSSGVQLTWQLLSSTKPVMPIYSVTDACIVLEAIEDDECELAWLPGSAEVSDEQVKLG